MIQYSHISRFNVKCFEITWNLNYRYSQLQSKIIWSMYNISTKWKLLLYAENFSYGACTEHRHKYPHMYMEINYTYCIGEQFMIFLFIITSMFPFIWIFSLYLNFIFIFIIFSLFIFNCKIVVELRIMHIIMIWYNVIYDTIWFILTLISLVLLALCISVFGPDLRLGAGRSLNILQWNAGGLS